MITEDREEVFIEATESSGLKIAAALAALLITAIVFAGYFYLRKRQVQSAAPVQTASTQPKAPPQALILMDEALLQGSDTLLGGTVRNTSNEKLNALSVELELKRRKTDTTERKQVAVTPSDLEGSQEGRYSLQLKAQDYISARVVGLHSGSQDALVPYTLAQGEKRPLEKLESKTIKIDKPAPGKRSEFLNSPDNPARVP
ncbi:MAG TPA: hypothetical protein VHR36_14360 [Pyrinomonadaceae bacterium]|jgi:hypothetical protein|nr:hypothetical protein [Pyrinomonadaceae bacterium]